MIFFYPNFAETFKEARERVNRAVNESDWESMPETMLLQSRVGRRVKKPDRFLNGDDEEGAESGGKVDGGKNKPKGSKAKSKPNQMPVKPPPTVTLGRELH